jgi:pimeloyl-ACP methyl ester carboxylesterase
VLLHGFGASRFTYRKWADELAHTHDLHLVDLVGFGAAPAPAARSGYGPLEQAEAVVRYLRERDLRGVTLIGHSLGGGVALLVALRLHEFGEHDRLNAIVSVGGPAYPQAIPFYIGLARLPLLGRLLLALLPTDRLVRKVLRFIVYDPSRVDDEQVEGYAGPLRTPRTRRAVLETARRIVPPNLAELAQRFGEISVPTLLLWGRHDHIIPLWVGQRLERDLPNARLVVLERCGHVPPEECAEESLGVLREFLRQIGRGASAQDAAPRPAAGRPTSSGTRTPCRSTAVRTVPRSELHADLGRRARARARLVSLPELPAPQRPRMDLDAEQVRRRRHERRRERDELALAHVLAQTEDEEEEHDDRRWNPGRVRRGHLRGHGSVAHRDHPTHDEHEEDAVQREARERAGLRRDERHLAHHVDVAEARDAQADDGGEDEPEGTLRPGGRFLEAHGSSSFAPA